MIKITLKEYKNIYKLLSAEAEDMEIGISNILNSDLSDYHKYDHNIIGFPNEEIDLFFAKAMGFEFLDNV